MGALAELAMDWLKLFFSFRGRVNRAGFWTVSVTWFVLGEVLNYIWTASGTAEIPFSRDVVVDAAFIAAALPALASCLAVCVTRLHDRNKSAGWLVPFVFCPPLIEVIASLNDLAAALMVALMVLAGALSLWAFVELGLLRGTAGANAYGPDPLADVALP
jgi:uncharacterized membrane protein YhaH (DUF805 family)